MSINEIIAELIESEAMKKAAERRYKAAKAAVMEYAAGRDFFETDEYSVFVKATESSRLDTDALYADFPEIKRDMYRKTTVSHSVTAAKREAEKKSA